ncbi:hypothetical protein JHK86_007601 [Glycine max]|nr:hypothetical protein JHK86_007601 [Glycine max]
MGSWHQLYFVATSYMTQTTSSREIHLRSVHMGFGRLVFRCRQSLPFSAYYF